MGWNYRKSINLGGGFRINLSKSGIGYSYGFPGYRVTHTATGRKRTTYSIPGTGIYHVSETSGKKNRQSVRKEHKEQLVTGNVEYYKNEHIEVMGSNDMIVQKIKRIRTINTLANFLLVFCLPVGILLKLLLFRETIELHYEFDELSLKSYELLKKVLACFSVHESLWQIDSSSVVYNIKYNAGASNSVTRNKIIVSKKLPWYLKSNIDIVSLKLKGETIYFTPDRILILKGFRTIGSHKYEELKIDYNYTSFVESERVPSDAYVLGNTWKYVNARGGPDRRFNNNYQIPVCKYGEIYLKSNAGINLLILCSNYEKVSSIVEEFDNFSYSLDELNKIRNESENIIPKSDDILTDNKESVNIEIVEEIIEEKNNNEEYSDKDEFHQQNNTNLEEKPCIERLSAKIKNITVKKMFMFICKLGCYMQVLFSAFVVFGCIYDGYYFSAFLWLICGFLFLPFVKNKIIVKYNLKEKNIYIIRIIAVIVASFAFTIALPDAFEGKWISNTGIVIELYDNQAKLQYDDIIYDGNYTYEIVDNTYYIDIKVDDKIFALEYSYETEKMNFIQNDGESIPLISNKD